MGVTNQGKEKITRKNAKKIMQNKKMKERKKGALQGGHPNACP